MPTTVATLLSLLALALLPAEAGCRHDGPAATTPRPDPADGPAADAPDAGPLPPAPDGVPAVLTAFVRLPDSGEPRWLNATVSVGGEGWFIAGCASRLAGVCHWNPRFALEAAERQAYAERIARVREMPRCEPPGFRPDDLPFDLDLDGEARPGHLPRSWFDESSEPEPPNDDSDPCRAEARLVWWIYEMLAARGRLGLDGPAPEPLPECSEACCGPGERAPDPAGMIECCFCGPL